LAYRNESASELETLFLTIGLCHVFVELELVLGFGSDKILFCRNLYNSKFVPMKRRADGRMAYTL